MSIYLNRVLVQTVTLFAIQNPALVMNSLFVAAAIDSGLILSQGTLIFCFRSSTDTTGFWSLYLWSLRYGHKKSVRVISGERAKIWSIRKASLYWRSCTRWFLHTLKKYVFKTYYTFLNLHKLMDIFRLGIISISTTKRRTSSFKLKSQIVLLF